MMLIVLAIFIMTIFVWLKFYPKDWKRKGKILLFNFIFFLGYSLFLLISLLEFSSFQGGSDADSFFQSIFGQVQLAEDLAHKIGLRVAEATVFFLKELVLVSIHVLVFWMYMFWSLWKQKRAIT